MGTLSLIFGIIGIGLALVFAYESILFANDADYIVNRFFMALTLFSGSSGSAFIIKYVRDKKKSKSEDKSENS